MLIVDRRIMPNHAHQGRLAGPVGADHTHRFASRDRERCAEQCLEGPVARVDQF
jgi:hypothetical protein